MDFRMHCATIKNVVFCWFNIYTSIRYIVVLLTVVLPYPVIHDQIWSFCNNAKQNLLQIVCLDHRRGIIILSSTLTSDFEIRNQLTICCFYVSKEGTVVDVHSHPILKLGTRWRRLSLTPRPFYPRRKSPLYSLNRILGGPQRRLGRFRKKVPFPCLNQTALGVVTTPTELYKFLLCIHRPT
jgi:hypothetical protein